MSTSNENITCVDGSWKGPIHNRCQPWSQCTLSECMQARGWGTEADQCDVVHAATACFQASDCMSRWPSYCNLIGTGCPELNCSSNTYKYGSCSAIPAATPFGTWGTRENPTCGLGGNCTLTCKAGYQINWKPSVNGRGNPAHAATCDVDNGLWKFNVDQRDPCIAKPPKCNITECMIAHGYGNTTGVDPCKYFAASKSCLLAIKSAACTAELKKLCPSWTALCPEFDCSVPPPSPPTPPPPPPPPGCNCSFLYWESDTNCTHHTSNLYTIHGGMCNPLSLPFERSISVALSSTCQEWRGFNGSTCAAPTTTGIRQSNGCVPFANGASSGLMVCGV
eukprot:TRINITY_DN66555_c8_g3_i1.p1 TRINITY_DN66555_c8_g3~~TRINITY_DN66555_c8_g3_i1.p1  ORF type:complete len:336 (+),score=44.76 TRINITY_DN66555_c8_g3_i1:202-1209(+)